LGEAQASKNWPIAQGEVVSTRTRRQSSTTSNSTSNSSRTYTFEVTYAYEVAGERYESDRFSLGNGSTASRRYPERSEAVVAANQAYPTGSPLEVYYDPQAPSAAVLQPGASWATYMPLVLGAFFLAVGAGSFWLMRNLAVVSTAA
jgi:hypothetical protein